MSDDLNIHKKIPPETETEWQHFHRSVWRMEQAWPIVGPIVAIVTNWKGDNIFPIDLDSYEGQILEALAANKKTHREIINMLKA